MKTKVNKIPLFVLALVVMPVLLSAQTMEFTRAHEIPVPDIGLNVGGLGNFVAGYDLDADSRPDLYAVNHNWGDGPSEMIPRLYKFEYTGTAWEIVWQCSIATAVLEKVNTWPALTIGDLDGDTKDELIFGPVNWATTAVPVPARVVVYEEAGDGTDVMGVVDGTNYLPNSSWSIIPDSSKNLRPFRWEVADIDNDGTAELVFGDRVGSSSSGFHMFFGVASVDDIPDTGGDTETWTLETSGLDFGDLYADGVENKWDMCVLDSTAYFFDEMEISRLAWTGSAWTYDSLPPMPGGAPWNNTQVVDLDDDGTKEIISAVYDYGDDTKKSIMLLQEDAVGDTLKFTELFNVTSYWTDLSNAGLMGGDVGDIDGDGYLDFVYGSRDATVNASIFRMAYKGGDITLPASYELTIIDSTYATGGRWGVVGLADYDGDDKDEVFYTSTVPAGGSLMVDDSPQPIVVLDYAEIVATEPTSGLPVAYELYPNFPNPFNPSTTISFMLPQAVDVRLVVFDLLGRNVVTLVEGNEASGYHQVVWNGRNALGREVSTGVYIARLTSPAYSKNIKMVLLK